MTAVISFLIGAGLFVAGFLVGRYMFKRNKVCQSGK